MFLSSVSSESVSVLVSAGTVSVLLSVYITVCNTLRASCGAVYFNRPCLFVGLWVCYHDNSKLRASIFIKLGLYVKVVIISS